MEFALLLGGIRDSRRMAVEKTGITEILSLFTPEDPERAEDEYLCLRSKLTWYFDRHIRHCENPEDLADETLYRVVKALAKDRTIYAANPFAYIWAVANHVKLEVWKRGKPRLPAGNQPLSWDPRSDLENHIFMGECIKAALSPEEQKLLTSYMRDGSKITAARLNISPTALKVRVHRIKNKIRDYVQRAQAEQDSEA